MDAVKPSAPLILLVEDEPHIADVAEFLFHEQGWACRRAGDGTLGWRLFQELNPDLVLLDLGLPGLDGLELLRRIRGHAPDRAVVILTARSDVEDRVRGMEAGADDYLPKPFDNRELVARVRAVLRRCPPAGGAPLQRGPLRMDPEGFHATLDQHPLPLPRHEFLLLEALLRHPEQTFTRERLMENMYGGEAAFSDRTVDAAVNRLRKKIQKIRPDTHPIESVYGLGYRLTRDWT